MRSYMSYSGMLEPAGILRCGIYSTDLAAELGFMVFIEKLYTMPNVQMVLYRSSSTRLLGPNLHR